MAKVPCAERYFQRGAATAIAPAFSRSRVRMAATVGAVGAFSSRVDALVERLDRQADAVRSMFTAYSQRENELQQLVDGLARLRAFPAQMPSAAL